MKFKNFIINKKNIFIFCFILTSLPLIFITCMYVTARRTGLEGARGGPQDAFRHTYTSAFVARYASPHLVKIATALTERNSNSEYDKMDIHNNYLGIQLGLSNIDLYSTIINKIKNVELKTKDHNKIYIMDKSDWKSSDIF